MNSTPRSQAHRKARRDAGLVPLSVWVPAERKAEIRAMVEDAVSWTGKCKPLFADGVQDYIEGTAEEPKG